MASQRISLVTKYILDHFDQKTYRGDKAYIFNQLTNISDVVSAERGAVEEIKQKQRVSGFNSILRWLLWIWQNYIMMNSANR